MMKFWKKIWITNISTLKTIFITFKNSLIKSLTNTIKKHHKSFRNFLTSIDKQYKKKMSKIVKK